MVKIIEPDFQRKSDNPKSQQKEEVIASYQLRLQLPFSTPSIWRTVKVPGDITLEQLSDTIKICFGWNDDNDHCFLVGKIFYSPLEQTDNQGNIGTTEIQLHELEEYMGFIFTYHYEGGSGWECEITIDEILPKKETLSHPQVIDGERAAPGNSFDDMHEFEQVVEKLDLGSSAEIVKLLSQYNLGKDYDPSYFETDNLKEQLQAIQVKK